MKPLALGELLDRAVRLYRRHFFQFVGIVAIFQIPFALLQLVLSVLIVQKMADWDPTAQAGVAEAFSGYPFGELAASFLLSILGFIFIQGLATAALTRAIADNYLGEPVDILRAYQNVGSAWGRVLVALILLGLFYIPLFLWTMVPCIGWFTGLGIIFYVTLAVNPMIAPVVVLERRGAADAIRRAWDLVRRRFWWILGFMLILTLFAQLLVTIPSTVINIGVRFLLGDSIDPMSTGSPIDTIIQSLVGVATSLIYLPLQLIAITLVYFDLRVRTEGFDLAMLARAGRSEAGLGSLTVEAPSVTESPQLITGTELTYFVLVTFLAAIVFFIVGAIGAALSFASLSLVGG
jgi:hypothetical protein